MPKNKERSQRIVTMVRNKMQYLFKETLTEVEKETKEFEVNTDFFAKNPGGKQKGFYAIRKKLFDHGNGIIEFIDLVLNQLELTPTDSIITISKEALEDSKDEKKK